MKVKCYLKLAIGAITLSMCSFNNNEDIRNKFSISRDYILLDNRIKSITLSELSIDTSEINQESFCFDTYTNKNNLNQKVISEFRYISQDGSDTVYFNNRLNKNGTWRYSDTLYKKPKHIVIKKATVYRVSNFLFEQTNKFYTIYFFINDKNETIQRFCPFNKI